MNTAHPEVALLLHGEDEWLAELVSRSECVGQRACSSNLSDGASSATAGRRSIHDPEVALLLRGEENWLAELVSRSEPSLVQVSSASDDNQDVEKKSVPASSISSQKLGEKLNRVYKWGACPRCGGARSLQPHVLSENSKTPGKLVLYCSGWWKAGSQNGRACWYQQDFPQDKKMKFLAFSKISTQICECPYIAMDVSVGPRTVTPDQWPEKKTDEALRFQHSSSVKSCRCYLRTYVFSLGLDWRQSLLWLKTLCWV